jgi:hypothetical protein
MKNIYRRSEKRFIFVSQFRKKCKEAAYSAKQKKKIMMQDIRLVADKALPTLSLGSLTYNAEKNVYLTVGYTSAADNTYYQAVRFSDRLAVYYDIGIGHYRTFLNGITLMAWNGEKARIIARKFWGGCGNWVDFSESTAKEESITMLKDYLAGQARLLGNAIADSQLLAFSRNLIEETRQKLLR